MSCTFSGIEAVEQSRVTAVLPHFFSPDDGCSAVGSLGAGNINDTYLVEFHRRTPVVLQRLNTSVFPEPMQVIENGGAITEHLSRQQLGGTGVQIFPGVVAARDGKNHFADKVGDIWRASLYVDNTITCQSPPTARHAFEGGRILGRFHRLLADLEPASLHHPIPGFHDLPGYCERYRAALFGHRRDHCNELGYCCGAINDRLADASILEQKRELKVVIERVIHGDPKCDNILFDRDSDSAVAIIDLDTVSPGLLQYDIGDCLRSFCNPAGESPGEIGAVRFDTDMCRQVLAGYYDSGMYLPVEERDLVYQGVRLLTFELGVRFLTDYLEGDRYFKVGSEQENLQRALVQVKLLESIERQHKAIESITASIGW